MEVFGALCGEVAPRAKIAIFVASLPAADGCSSSSDDGERAWSLLWAESDCVPTARVQISGRSVRTVNTQVCVYGTCPVVWAMLSSPRCEYEDFEHSHVM